MASDGSLITKKDFSSEIQTVIPQARQIASVESLESLEEAIQLLLTYEKKCRLANDFSSLKEVCLTIIQLCYEKGDWNRLNSALVVINKRRSQSKVAITAVVQEAYSYISKTPTLQIKIDLINSLISVCEGYSSSCIG